MRVVIIGGSFAGIQTAVSLRRECPASEIVLLEKQERVGFIPSSVNLFLKGKLHNEEECYWITKEQLINDHHIEVRTSTEVVSLNGDSKQVQLKNGEALFFDYLVIATGSNQQFSGNTIVNESIRRIKDQTGTEALYQKIVESKKIAVVGGGQVGLELVEGLSDGTKEVHLYESQPTLLFRYFDPEMVVPLVNELKKHRVSLFLNEQVQQITEDEPVQLVTEQRKDTYDLILLANHTKPDNHIWEDHLRLNDDGTIWVNDYLQTSHPAIFAIGDAIQVSFRPTDEKMYVSLVNNAIRTANIASKNISGTPTKDLGTYRPIGNRWFGYFFGSVGLTEEESIFYPHKIMKYFFTTRASAMNQEVVKIKILCDEKGQLIGAQCYSKATNFHFLDQLTFAIEEGWTLAQLEAHELFFQPEFRTPVSLVKAVDSFNET
ncbi:hypothetical protein A5844_001354 [Enterococcus sp. 10A9_DIV0425]|uniref:Pyridine nucleotide-disulfide oxidoreductase n=1 Tax=Candidatus Enterococcus wittei TaxID=1987383 RepID=A0A242K0P2_9ENTE|nr:FAD/NAD(P)-binding oxidoreductase [Enterococcus sp. 10A9_DIV0425]OTP11220.1 hypothetical protein A5844_001354 [Enterococcus sp. 10A9_DIV0425]THE15773.1 pyridine nucleotide-disulfide oxidoreductase [Enterococcus hirae]